jgi:tetratricopeptide (TPR) repeat protein
VELQAAHEQIVHLLKAGQAQRAEEQARLILKGRPQEPNTVFLLAKARHLRGASAEAVELLDSLIASRRDWLSVHQEKALVLRACGALAGAVASLREVVRLDPNARLRLGPDRRYAHDSRRADGGRCGDARISEGRCAARSAHQSCRARGAG